MIIKREYNELLKSFQNEVIEFNIRKNEKTAIIENESRKIKLKRQAMDSELKLKEISINNNKINIKKLIKQNEQLKVEIESNDKEDYNNIDKLKNQLEEIIYNNNIIEAKFKELKNNEDKYNKIEEVTCCNINDEKKIINSSLYKVGNKTAKYNNTLLIKMDPKVFADDEILDEEEVNSNSNS